ncbi:MAG: RbsD/FucU family protein [Paenibacillaceae bacterium]|nr:RbsD/FucU family protein [Paenibacillaceae bacterium]
MLKTACLHPELLRALAACGHGDKVLIADGNYPLDSGSNVMAQRVYLNLTHGIPLVTDVLKVLDQTIPIEKAEVMLPDSGDEPAIFAEFRSLLGGSLPLDGIGRFAFYDACREANVKIAIATGEQRIYANLLLTVGVVPLK